MYAHTKALHPETLSHTWAAAGFFQSCCDLTSPFLCQNYYPKEALGSNQNYLDVKATISGPRFSFQGVGKMFDQHDQKEEW